MLTISHLNVLANVVTGVPIALELKLMWRHHIIWPKVEPVAAGFGKKAKKVSYKIKRG